MSDNIPKFKSPKILAWYGRAIILFGILVFITGFFAGIISILKGEGIIVGLYTLYDICGTSLGICGFGSAIAFGKRWHIFLLLNLVFFGSFLIGLFSMVGRETNIGYYIWAIGGIISLSLLLILYVYWDKFLDD